MSKSLLQRAHRIEEWAEQHFRDPHGIIYTYIDTEHERPVTDSFFTPDQEPICHPGVKPADWHSYENCSMATAAYMMGLIYRYRVEQDPIALARTRRSFDALRYIYGMGRQLEEGFLPKIYGDQFSLETSTDQVLYVMYALDAFHPHGTPEEQKEIDRMMAHIVRFWVKRGYRYTYFWTKDMLWPLNRFPTLLLMAYNHSGDEAFKAEYDRLLSLGVTSEAVEADVLPLLQEYGVAIFSSAPLAMRLLSAEGPPEWHPAPIEVREKCAEAARICSERGFDLGKLALQFSLQQPGIHTTVVGTANPERVRENVIHAGEALDEELLEDVRSILAPVHNMTWPSGRPENNQ